MANKVQKRKTTTKKTGSAAKTARKKPAPKRAVKRAAKTSKTAQRRQTNKEITMSAKKAQKSFDNIAQETADMGREQMDALSRSSSIFAKGMEDIMKSYMSLAQVTAEKNSEAFKTIIASRTLDEFAEAQNKFAQESFDDFMSGATKLSEISVRVCTDCFEPLNDQLSKGIKRASENIAA